jgi:hypothetical protein
MWALMLILLIVHHFPSDPTRMWHGSLFKQLPNTQRRGLPFPTHTHTQQKLKLKLKTLKTILRKPQEGEKRPMAKNRDK